ncbi:MAG: hypothetical protein MJZ84_08420 [Paludibacteraceae bacterium]|nr:hypothetical protein [Paludibacteraceae bacterium]
MGLTTYETFAEERRSINEARLWSDSENSKLSKLAVDKFGTTSNPKHVTWVLPNGECIDGSGRKLGNSYPDPNTRYVDHREISSIIYDDDDNELISVNPEPDMYTCLDNGWVRMSFPYGFDMGAKLTDEQTTVITQLMVKAKAINHDDLMVTIFNNGKTVDHIEAKYVDSLLDKIDSHFGE